MCTRLTTCIIRSGTATTISVLTTVFAFFRGVQRRSYWPGKGVEGKSGQSESSRSSLPSSLSSPSSTRARAARVHELTVA